MEGLYFESSASTPFHFLNQSTLSVGPSRAQRDLPYQNFDIDRGVAQLQTVGVRYYMAQSDEAIAAADGHPDLEQIAEAQPFVIYQVSDSSLVQGLGFEPVVASGPTEENVTEVSTRFDVGWESQAVAHYNNPAGFQALPAERGPAEWQRVSTLASFDGRAITPALVSDIEVGRSSITFSVDEIGSPVLVKMSYFPNWKVSGADGPYRAGPNLMVVIPSDTVVELSYGFTLVEYGSFILFLLGCSGAFALARDGARSSSSGVPNGAAASPPGLEPVLDDDIDERVEPDLFARLLAESSMEGAANEIIAETPHTAPSYEVDLAERMLGALDDDGRPAKTEEA
jgi:hypothetical protein